jgi:PBSX family phage terminase large subunit
VNKEELDKLIAKMTPAERSEFFALVAAEKKEPVFRSPEHEWQTRFLDDPSRMKVLLCTRRAGKSYAAGLMLLEAAYKNPNVSCLYVALTRASAKRIMWKDVLKTIDREQGLGCRFNETELSCTLPNGSIIYLLGMDADEQEKEKALGQKFKAVCVDEAASYNVDLHEIVYDILKPALADYRGTLALIGTPGNIKRGVFFNLTQGQDPSEPGQWEKDGWSCYRWTTFQNPKLAEQWKAEIEDLTLANPSIAETPGFQQHYLGKWVIDNTNLVYRFDSSKNTFDSLPTMMKGGRWHYVLGIDLGFNDPTAWVVCAYHDFDRTLYVLGAHKKEKCDITEVADQTRVLMGKFEFDRIVIDNANKQAVEEMRRRHDIPLTPAEKTGKSDFIELMNADFVSGYIKLNRKAAATLMDEYGTLIWDSRSLRREEHPASPNHCADAALYAWRHCYQWLSEVRHPNGLKHGRTDEDWMLMQEEQEMERLLADRQAQDEEIALWGQPLIQH